MEMILNPPTYVGSVSVSATRHIDCIVPIDIVCAAFGFRGSAQLRHFRFRRLPSKGARARGGRECSSF